MRQSTPGLRPRGRASFFAILFATVVLVQAGCSTRAPAASPLDGSAWVLIGLAGVSLPKDAGVTLVFEFLNRFEIYLLNCAADAARFARACIIKRHDNHVARVVGRKYACERGEIAAFVIAALGAAPAAIEKAAAVRKQMLNSDASAGRGIGRQ